MIKRVKVHYLPVRALNHVYQVDMLSWSYM